MTCSARSTRSSEGGSAGSRLGRRLAAAVEVAAGLLLLAVILLTLAQVAARYVLGVSLPWSEELNRLLFVWMAMIAAVGAPHMRIDALTLGLPPAARRGLILVSGVVSVLLLALLVWGAYAMMQLTANDRYTALGLSLR